MIGAAGRQRTLFSAKQPERYMFSQAQREQPAEDGLLSRLKALLPLFPACLGDLPGALESVKLRAPSIMLRIAELPVGEKHRLVYHFLALREEVSAVAQGLISQIAIRQRQAVVKILAEQWFSQSETEEILCGTAELASIKLDRAEMPDFWPWLHCANRIGEQQAAATRLLCSFENSVGALVTDLVTCYMPVILKRAETWFPRSDPELLHDSVTNAFLLIGRHFNPERGTLRAFLRGRIRGLPGHRKRTQARRLKREITLPGAELEQNQTRTQNFGDPDTSQVVDGLFPGLSEGGRTETIYLAERRSVQEWAELLGWKDKPEAEQCKLVYGERRRVRKGLRDRLRLADDSH